MADFTPTQGRYLAFIHAYTCQRGCPPAEADIAAALCVSPPSVNTMVKMLEKKGLILRQPGRSRSLQVLVPEDEIPAWNSRKLKRPPGFSAAPAPVVTAAPAANLYVITVFLKNGPISEQFAGKRVMRILEVRGDQTLDDLHLAILKAYDREENQRYEFQLGKRPFDPAGPNYGIPKAARGKVKVQDARTNTLDQLELKPERVFGYLFDPDRGWYHQVQIDRVE